MKKKDDLDDTISSRSYYKLPLGAIFSLFIGAATFSYAQFEKHKAYDNERFNDLHNLIERKTDARFTSHEAAKLEESIKQRFSDVEKKNDAEHRSLQRQIERNSRDIGRLRKP